jgi:hypothetical protein
MRCAVTLHGTWSSGWSIAGGEDVIEAASAKGGEWAWPGRRAAARP